MRPSYSTLLALAALACTATSTDSGTGAAATSGTGNLRPVAEAGTQIDQSADTAVQLNGTASRDPDGDPITFLWTFSYTPEGSELSGKEMPFTKNNSADAGVTTFQPDKVGTYIVQLVVTDDKGNASAPDTVIVTITEPEQKPVADAGPDVVSSVGAAVALSGTGSYDAQGRTLAYAWALVDKPASSLLTGLSAADTAAPSFIPDARGVYVVNLVVDNGLAKSNADAVTVTVTGEDSSPVANAGADQSDAEDCTTISLDCSGSVDPDGDRLSYQWAVQTAPSAYDAKTYPIADTTASRTTFYPNAAGRYVLSCAVFDGKTWSTPDTMVIEAAERASNSAPTADAGADVAVDAGSADCDESGYTYNCAECADVSTMLGSDARAADPDGDPISIEWTLKSSDGSAEIADPHSLATSVTLEDAEPEEPDECLEIEHVFTLTVTDCTGAVSRDDVKITATCCGYDDTGA
jgi:hypothetical protein